jgi:hypothetical protein
VKQITVSRTVFTLDELEPDARDKAIETLREAAWEDLDSDMVAEDLAGRFIELATGEWVGATSKNTLKDKYGIVIYWSVSYIQSDDAQISGTLDAETSPNLDWPDGVRMIGIRSNNYSGSTVTWVDTDDDERHYDGQALADAQQMVNNLNSQLYREVRKLVEGYTSENYVIDCYNNYEDLQRRFDATGKYAPPMFWAEV